MGANSLQHVRDHMALQACCTHVQVCMSVSEPGVAVRGVGVGVGAGGSE